MPKVTDSRIKPGDGEIVFQTTNTDNTASATGLNGDGNSQGDGGSSNNPLKISGNNLGEGFGIYAGTNGTSRIVIDYRSLIAGEGVVMTGDAHTITISSPANSSRPNLGDLPGSVSVIQGGTGVTTLPLHGIMVGNGTGPVQTIELPTAADRLLSWDGSRYKWIPTPEAVTPTTTSVVSSDPLITSVLTTDSQGNRTYTLDFKENEVAINNLAGTLAVTKGGTGKASFTANALVVGAGTAAPTSAPVPTTAGQYLIWNGSAYAWGTAGTVTSVGAVAGSPKVTVTGGPITGSGAFTIDVDPSQIAIGSLSGTLDVTKGGTGLTTLGPTGTYLRVNAAGTGFEFANVSGGSGGTVTSVGLTAGSNKVEVSGGPITSAGSITVDVNEAHLSLANIPGNISVAKGGTGLVALGTPYQVLRTNATGNALEYATLTLADLPGLAPVATSGNYNDLTNTPFLAPIASSAQYTDLIGAPVLANVATSGSYNDLTDKPVTGGTVTSVAISAGSNKVSVTGGPIVDSGIIAVDLVEGNVTLGNLGGILPAIKGGTGLSATVANGVLVGSASNTTAFTAAPSAAGQALTWNGTGFVWTNPGTSYVLPTASASILGGVKVGTNLSINGEGELNNDITDNAQLANGAGYAVADDLATIATTGQWVDIVGRPAVFAVAQGGTGISSYTPNSVIFAASANTLGQTAPTAAGQVLKFNGTTFTWAAEAGAYELPDASTTEKGGIIVGGGLEILDGVLSVSADAGLGTVTSVALTSSNNAITVSGSPITSAGAITVTFDETKVNVGNTTGNLPAIRVTGLGTVATTNSYADLSNKPVLFSGSYNDLTDKPTIFSGSYTDLTDKPTFATVAMSGSYNDLTDKPTGLSYDDADARAAISVTGDLTYNSTTGVIGYTAPTLATVATSGDYADLTNKPTLFSGSYNDLTNKPTLFSGSYDDLTNKPVLFSGLYEDLEGAPTIPTQYTDTLARAAISAAGDLTYDATTGVMSYTAPAGSGEANTASNVGTLGAGVFKQKSGVDLQFRKIVAGTNVTVTEGVDEVVISATGGGGGEPSGGLTSFQFRVNYEELSGGDTIESVTGLPAGWSAVIASNKQDITVTHTVGKVVMFAQAMAYDGNTGYAPIILGAFTTGVVKIPGAGGNTSATAVPSTSQVTLKLSAGTINPLQDGDGNTHAIITLVF